MLTSSPDGGITRRMQDPVRLYRSAAGHQAVMEAYQAMLRRLVVPYQSFVVATRFGDTHGIAAGPPGGRAILLLHGWNTSAPGWWPQMNDLARRYRVYAPDTVGQGGKSAPCRPSPRGPAYGQWAADVAAGLGLQQADWVGSSGGAWLIFKLAEHAPERIRSAALISPAGITPVRLGFLLRAVAAGMLRPTAATPARLARLVSPSPQTLDEDHIQQDAPLLLHLRAQPPPPTLPSRSLRRLTAPTLLLIGEHEVVFDRRRLIGRAQGHIPGLVTAEVIPNAGHDLTYDQPQEVNAHLNRFLEEVPFRPGAAGPRMA